MRPGPESAQITYVIGLGIVLCARGVEGPGRFSLAEL